LSTGKFAYFFKENEAYVNASIAEDVKASKLKAKKAEKIVAERTAYPSPSGMSPFSMGLEYGAEGVTILVKDRDDVHLDPRRFDSA
jgi:hypothetical protein